MINNKTQAVKAAVGGVFYSTVASQLEVFSALAQTQVKSLHSKLEKLRPKEMAALLRSMGPM